MTRGRWWTIVFGLVAACSSGPTDKVDCSASIPCPDGFACEVSSGKCHRIDAGVFMDAPLATDAKVFDASLVDARPSDAPLAPDARAVDAPLADAAATPDAKAPDAAALTLRGWAGPTAGFRLIDLQMFSHEAGTKVCLFDDDDDPRPYAVIVDRSREAADLATPVPATYVQVPAGIPLRASVHLLVALGGGPLDGTPSGCNRAAATPIRGGGTLTTGSKYTGARTSVDDFFANCDTSATDGCDFFPKFDSGRPDAPCAAEGLYVVRDGKTLGGAAGYRVINLTSNAAMISHTVTTNSFDIIRNLSLSSSGVDNAYEDPAATTTVRICPRYLQGCFDGELSGLAQTQANLDCAGGDDDWTVAKITSSRVTSNSQTTTFYVFRDARRLRGDHTGLLGVNADVLTAIDP